MATVTEDQAAYDSLKSAVRVHIADIKERLTSTDASNTYIEAAVQLVWPFSSVTSQLSLLLIEKDVSFRDTAAQLKITFHDACAKEVARSRIGIGDIVQLRLGGATAEHEHEELSTPGKKTGFDLHFRKSVHLQASTFDGQIKTVNFTVPPPTVLNGDHPRPVTPLRNGSIDALVAKTRVPISSTPAWKKALRISSNSFPGSGSLVDPFAEDDGYIQGYGRKRTKFARRSNQWRLADAVERRAEETARSDHGDSGSYQPTVEQAVSDPSVDLVETSSPLRSEEGRIELTSVQSPGPTHGKREASGPAAGSTMPRTNLTEVDPEKFVSVDRAVSGNTHSRSVSPEIQISVERHSTDGAVVPGMLTPTPAALVASDFFAPDSTTDQAHTFSGSPQVTIDLDDNAPMDNHTSAEMSRADRQEPSYFFQATEPAASLHPALPQALDTNTVKALPPDNLPHAISEPAGIDLDKLQEQIDMDNNDFVPESHLQVIEDDDMYGAPTDGEIGMELQHIEEIRSRMSSMEPQGILEGEQPASTFVTSQNENYDEGLLRGTHVEPTDEIYNLHSQQASLIPPLSDEVSFQPYPSQIEAPIIQQPRQEVEISEDEEEEERSPASPSGPPQSQLQFLDGAVDFHALGQTTPQDAYGLLTDTIGLGQTNFILPSHETRASTEIIVPTSHLVELEVEDEEDPSPIQENPPGFSKIEDLPEVSNIEPVSTSPQHTAKELQAMNSINAVVSVFTPEATQTTVVAAGGDELVEPHIAEQFPPTPVESQPQISQISQAEPLDEEEEAQITQTEPALVRPTPNKDLPHRDYIGGIASPYFTPRVSTITPDTAMQSLKVHGSSRMRLRSSSPADFPVDHLESERLAAVATSTNEITNVSGDDRILSSTQKGMITPLEYYANLTALGEYYNQLVDIMAVCTADLVIPERAKSGPKDFFTTIHLADPSIETSGFTIPAQLFRPSRTALPAVSRGDILLLRRFKVQTQSHKPMLLSTDESAWAVYESIGHGKSRSDDNTVIEHPVVAGPPIEYGPFERDNASRLLKWWHANVRDANFDSALQTSPNKATSITADKRLKKPPPAPMDLRRSPRRTKTLTGIETNQLPTSPIFLQESPTLSMQSQASPQSPTSTRSLRSQTSPTKTLAQVDTVHPLTTPRNKPRPKPATRPQHQSTSTSPDVQRLGNSTPLFPDKTPKDFSSSNSVASSVTQTSSSSKKRRYERRSISLVHQLRDGTEWVDIEQEEVYSVTETESEGDDEGDGEANKQPETVDQVQVPEPKVIQEPHDPLSLDAVEDEGNPSASDAETPAIPAQTPTRTKIKSKAKSTVKTSAGRSRKQTNTTEGSPLKRTRSRPKPVDTDHIRSSSSIKTPASRPEMSPPLHSPTSDRSQGQLGGDTRTTRSKAAGQKGTG